MTDEEREDLNTFRHDLVKQARWWQWKAETLEKENEQLKAENAALRERLEKAVELKAKVGDTIFLPWIYDDVSGVGELQVCAIHFLYDGSIIYSTDLEKGYGEGVEERGFLMKYHYGAFSQDDFGSMVYTFKEAAEARLAELKGGKE